MYVTGAFYTNKSPSKGVRPLSSSTIYVDKRPTSVRIVIYCFSFELILFYFLAYLFVYMHIHIG